MLPSEQRLPLFAFGTLRDPTFVSALLERPVSAEPAVLTGFELVQLQAIAYPVVVEAHGKEVQGRLYRSLSANDYTRLDAYEGVREGLYQRQVAEVTTGQDRTGPAASEPAFVYVPTGKTLQRYG
jgi:gamma-glutamylcyclotransferase (GGCT)/AIG2-like uncharacterized protein YtfP